MESDVAPDHNMIREELDEDVKYLLSNYPMASIILSYPDVSSGQLIAYANQEIHSGQLEDYEVPTWLFDREFNGLVLDDANPGTIDSPWKTARKGFTSARPGNTVFFRKGVYRDPRTIKLPVINSSPQTRMFFKGYPGEEAIICGGELKNNPADWTHITGDIYMTRTVGETGP